MMEKSRKFLASLGLPEGDLYDLPTSTERFAEDGVSQYGVEIPTMNSAEAVAALLDEADRLGIVINKVDETYGAFRHTMEELKEYAKLCKDRGVALNISIGPRAAYDTSATRMSPQGSVIAYRLRGMEQVVRALEDAKRICEVGVRGLLVYDEGMMWVLDQARKNGELPKEVVLKNSAHNGQGNPASFSVIKNMLGADSINPVRDLELPMLAALRKTIGNTPLDLHTDNPPGSGGFIRVYEAPEMVRVASPVFLKTGNSAVSGHGQLTTKHDGILMARQSSVVVEMVKRYYPEAVQLKPGVCKGQVV